MKPEDKDLKRGAELNEDELDGVTGGSAINANVFTAQGWGDAAQAKNGAKFAQAQQAVAGLNGIVRPGLASNAVNPTNRENQSKM